MTNMRAAAVRRSRPRGVYVPPEEVPALLANGWRVLDDCPGHDEALLAPPRAFEREAA